MNQLLSFVIIATIMLVAAQNCHCETKVQQARGKIIQTPELWGALGCIITDDDTTKCVRDHTITVGRKDEDDASDEEVNVSSEDNSPGLFDAISAFVNDGIFRFFEDGEKDKNEETDSQNDSDEHYDDTDDDDDYDDDENGGGGGGDDADDDDDEDDYDSNEDLDDTSNFVSTSNRTTSVAIKRKNKRSVEEAEESRRRRRKGDKMMKLMMLGMMLKSKLNTIMMVFGAFMQLKFFALSMLNLLVGLVRLYIDLTKKKEPQKVIYYEQAHHQHVYDQQHEDKGWLGGWLSKNDDTFSHDINGDPHSMPYYAQKPMT